MNNRKQEIKELMENFQSLRRIVSFHTAGFPKMPRITHSQWGVLMMLKSGKEYTVKDVAESLCISSSAATQLIDGLVENGYLVRETNAKDRRSVKLSLSTKTKNQVGKMQKMVVRNFLNFFEALNNKELNQYILLNKKIVNNFLKNHVGAKKRAK
jgi:DNA-binding MarR family transcriptional regulator